MGFRMGSFTRRVQREGSRVRGWLTFSLLALLLSAGCDTVAEITFVKESLSSLTVVGFRPVSCDAEGDPLSLCEPPGCGSLDFYMETNVGRFMAPNQQISGLDGRLLTW